MKHFLKVFLLVMLIGLLGCSPLESLTKDRPKLNLSEFKDKMESNDFVVLDVSTQFSEEKHVEGVYIAQKDNYEIEFFYLNNNENAVKVFNGNKATIDREKGESSFSTNQNIRNFSSYALKTDGSFKYISRIDNTFLYLNVAEEYEEEVRFILEKLGY